MILATGVAAGAATVAAAATPPTVEACTVRDFAAAKCMRASRKRASGIVVSETLFP